MKAFVYHDYGPPEVLKCEEVEKPVPEGNEVLIRVRAASVNPLDCGMMKGKPYLFRIFFGLPKPRVTRPGRDVAGEVEAVGANVTEFKPGDAVFGLCTAGTVGDRGGAFAEYVCTCESALASKPEAVTFEQAASSPIAGLTALQGLRDKGRLQAGQKVLINGASGGVGTFAIQIAKAHGAEVTAVCSARNTEMVKSIGADHVIDYTQENFTKRRQRYDLIFDLAGNHSFWECRQVLTPRGTFLGVGVIGAPVSFLGLFARLAAGLALSQFVGQKYLTFIAKPSKQDLDLIGQMMASGKLKPVIDRRYCLSETPDAMRYLDQSHARGKVLIAPIV